MFRVSPCEVTNHTHPRNYPDSAPPGYAIRTSVWCTPSASRVETIPVCFVAALPSCAVPSCIQVSSIFYSSLKMPSSLVPLSHGNTVPLVLFLPPGTSAQNAFSIRNASRICLFSQLSGANILKSVGIPCANGIKRRTRLTPRYSPPAS